jgi:pre-mRNA cleavage complex 2 protein Pcf11
MSYGIPSDEVAEDYRRALEDLGVNSRYEISNLTVIAKENTEHALAISEALKNHIKQVGQYSTFILVSFVCLSIILSAQPL